MEKLYYTRMPESLAGPLLLAAWERGLALLEFDRGVFPPRAPAFRNQSWEESAGGMEPYVSQLREYFAGQRRAFEFAVDLRGTDFQKSCWRALLEIPYGETRTYAEIARAVGCARGFRAVGMANHDNPVAIVVPCHRVLASDGKLGGYGGGLDLKRKLLDLEGVSAPASAKGGAHRPRGGAQRALSFASAR
jgi:O-6-methylguanine DNA methyltransferase